MAGKININYYCRGVSLIEVAIALALLLTATLGTLSFRYYASIDTVKAQREIEASRLASLLCESWIGNAGNTAFDPVALLGTDLTITTTISGEAVPSGFTELEKYEITVDGVEYLATLSWEQTTPEIRTLNVILSWPPQGKVTDENDYKQYYLTTCVMI